VKVPALTLWRERASDWWADRSSREQMLLGVLAALAMTALLLIAVVRPLEATRARAAADIRTYDMLAMRLRAAGPGLAIATHKGSPSQIVSQIAATSGLTVQRVEPENGKLRVVFADAPFEAVLRWVSEVERTSALRISEAQIERSSQGNGVSAQFLLAGG
jgi:general secretion pathway protein M